MAVYPRKQTVVTLIVCILAVGGVAFYVRGDFSRTKTPINTGSTDISVLTPPPLQEGADWRLQFIDKNSTSTTFKVPEKTAVSEPERLTSTDLLGRAFLTKYGELEQTGLITDSDSVTSVMGQLSKDTLDQLPSPKTYSVSDVKISASTTVELAAYGKSVTNAFMLNTPAQSEAQIANKALTENDMSALAEIDPIIAKYRALLSALKSTPVPIPLAQYHVNLLNSVSLAIYNAEAIRNIDTDPVRGLAGISLGLAAMQNIATVLYGVNDYLVAAGVSTSY